MLRVAVQGFRCRLVQCDGARSFPKRGSLGDYIQQHHSKTDMILSICLPGIMNNMPLHSCHITSDPPRGVAGFKLVACVNCPGTLGPSGEGLGEHAVSISF